MSIKFDWYKTPVPSGRKDKAIPHARIVPQGTVHTTQLCKMISEASTLSSADVKGVLEALNFWMGLYLSEGNSIELDGLGHFSPTLKSKTRIDEKGDTKIGVEIDTVSFRCSVSLKEKVREAGLEKVPRKNEEKVDGEQRKKNILAVVGKELSINSSRCMAMNHCSRYVALQDLKELESEGRVVKTGSGKQAVYIRPYTSGT